MNKKLKPDKPDDFTKSMIKKSSVSSQPGVSIKKEMKNVDSQRVDEKTGK